MHDGPAYIGTGTDPAGENEFLAIVVVTAATGDEQGLNRAVGLHRQRWFSLLGLC